MKILLVIAFRNLVQAKRRTLLLAGALSLVTMLLVILLAFSQGLTETMMKNATTIMSGHINIAGFLKAKPADAYPMITDKEKIKNLVKDTVKGLDYVVDRVRGWGKVVSETSSFQVALYGIDLQEEKNFLQVIKPAPEYEYKEGGSQSMYGRIEDLQKPGHALLFVAQAKRLGVGVGDLLTVTVELPGGRVNATQLTVAAVAKDFGFSSNWSLFIHKKSLYKLYDMDEKTSGAVMIYLKDINQLGQVMGDLQKTLVEKGFDLMDYDPKPFFMKFEDVQGQDWIGIKLDLTLWSDEVSFLKWILTAFDAISYFLLLILAAIICIGIMNTIWISVRDRTNEIGTIRAIGMSKFNVLLLFVLEAALLGLMATTVGSILGATLAFIIDAAAINVPSNAE